MNVLKLSFGISLLYCIIGVFIQDWNQDMKPAIWSFPAFLWFDWVLGAFIAERYIQGRRAFTSRAYVIIPLLLVFILSNPWKFGYILNCSLASVICAALLEIYLNSSRKLSIIEKFIIPIGLCSYSFYLWHQPLLPKFLHIASINGMYRSHLWNMTFGLFFSLFLTSSLSWLLYKYVEKPSVK